MGTICLFVLGRGEIPDEIMMHEREGKHSRSIVSLSPTKKMVRPHISLSSLRHSHFYSSYHTDYYKNTKHIIIQAPQTQIID